MTIEQSNGDMIGCGDELLAVAPSPLTSRAESGRAAFTAIKQPISRPAGRHLSRRRLTFFFSRFSAFDRRPTHNAADRLLVVVVAAGLRLFALLSIVRSRLLPSPSVSWLVGWAGGRLIVVS